MSRAAEKLRAIQAVTTRAEPDSGSAAGPFSESLWGGAAPGLPARPAPKPPTVEPEPAAVDLNPDNIPGVNPGWIPSHWVRRLRQLADCCQDIRPDLAAAHRRNADQIDAYLRDTIAESSAGMAMSAYGDYPASCDEVTA